jgi:hypothetical protein
VHQGIAETKSRRYAGAGNGSAKYCVSWTTFPAGNSIILTVKKVRLVADCVFRDPEVPAPDIRFTLKPDGLPG